VDECRMRAYPLCRKRKIVRCTINLHTITLLRYSVSTQKSCWHLQLLPFT